MNNLSVLTLVAQLAIAAETNATAQAFAEVMARDAAGQDTAKATASAEAHTALDALLDAHYGTARGAPDWAHDLLDFFWDLLF